MAMPPGIYFDPTPEECVSEYLIPWIQSGCADDAPMDGAVFPVDVYRHSPGELRQLFPPGHARGIERNWYFVTPRRESYGGCGKRGVATGGKWTADQKTKDLLDGGGKKRNYKFCLPDGFKTKWLMEELSLSVAAASEADEEGSASSSSMPVFCRIYVSPRTDDDERRAILGEDCVAVDVEGNPKPATVVVGQEYFDMLAARLPASCVRVHGGHVAAPAPGIFGHQTGQVAAPPPQDVIGHHQYVHPAPPPPPPVVYGHQQGQTAPPDFLDHYDHGQNAVFFDYPSPLPIHVAPQLQEEEETHQHVPKKPRLTYYANGDAAYLQHELPEEPPVPVPPPPVDDDALPPQQPPAIEFDACQQAPKDPSTVPQEESLGTTAVPPLVPIDDDGALPPQPPAVEFGATCDSSQLPVDDMPVDFNSFTIGDILKSITFDNDSPQFNA